MDADKIQNFLLYNFEKGIVAVVFLLAGFLVYSGMGTEVITDEADPEKLAADAKQVRNEVDVDHSEQIIPDRVPDFDIAAKQSEFRQAINGKIYNLDPFDPTLKDAKKVRREDPMLAKPMGLNVVGVVASMGYRSADGYYELAQLDPADELEVKEEKPRPSRRRNRRNAMMGMDEEMGGMDDMMDMDMEMEEMMMMGGAMGGPTSTDPAAGPVRKLASTDNLGATAQTTTALSNGDEQLPIPGPGIFIAGTAAIPHKALIDAYQEALSNAAEYQPMTRDRPVYIDYQVQRADVTDKTVDELKEEDWVTRDSRKETTLDAALYWAGFAPEIVPNDYTIPGMTMWIPPVLLDDYKHFAVNPLIPMESQAALEREALIREAELNKGPATLNPEDIELDRSGTATRNFGMMGMMGMEDMMGGMDDMMDEMGGMEDMMMMGGMGGSMGMAGKPAEENPVDYKLIRFYDFAFVLGDRKRDPNAPKMGREYVYRVRYGVNDPNFPTDEKLQPQQKSLAPDAYQRYVVLAAKAKETQKRDSVRWSEWSEPSTPSSLGNFDHSYVGPVNAEKSRRVKVGNRTVVVESTPAKAEVVASSFDPRLGAFVPTLINATEGTVLSAEVETADVVDPITLEVKKVEKPTIRSTATIIDIEGGIPLEIVDDSKMLEPGLFLMMDSKGKLKVKDSTAEQKAYRIKAFADERGM